MPNTREKLIELMFVGQVLADAMCDKQEECDKCQYNAPNACRCGFIADHLIANGVTFATDNNVGSKWIPVTERLPEIGDTYLVVVKYKYDHEKEYCYDVDVAMYCPYDDPDAYIDKRWNTFIDWDEGRQDLHITHWMPLPQPPKGE